MSTQPTSGGASACPQSLSATASRRGDTRPARRLAGMAAAVAAAALVLSACGGESDHGDAHGSTAAAAAAASTSATSGDSTGAHNDADIAFAQGMIVHHQGALEMAALAADRAGSDAVRQLADRIAAAQTPEIEVMTSWLQAWSAPAPSSASESMDHDMSGHAMPGDSSMDQAMGMMSAQDMTALEAASGADFDRRFLDLMIVHHQGAVTMSQTELADGRSTDALALAQTIIVSQTAEIAEMRGLLGAA